MGGDGQSGHLQQLLLLGLQLIKGILIFLVTRTPGKVHILYLGRNNRQLLLKVWVEDVGENASVVDDKDLH